LPFTNAPYCIIPYIPFTNCVSFSQHSPKYSEKYGLWEIVLCLRGKRGFDNSYFATYTGCHRRNGPNFGRVFLMLNYTDITQNTYVPS